MKNKIRHILFLAGMLIALAAAPAYTQMPVPIGPGDGDGATTPIGGLAVLAALGGGYAIKKLCEGKRKT